MYSFIDKYTLTAGLGILYFIAVKRHYALLCHRTVEANGSQLSQQLGQDTVQIHILLGNFLWNLC